MSAKNIAKFKRRQYLIAKKFQLKYVGIILLLMFLTAALCSYVVYYTSMLLLGEKLASIYPQGRLVSIVKIVNFRIFLSVALVTPLVALIGIVLSHRIAGPIYRMETFMANLAGGDLSSRIVLRKGDELMLLADAINRLVASLRESVMQKKSHSNKAKAELANLKKALGSRPIDQALADEALRGLNIEISSLGEVLEKYKL